MLVRPQRPAVRQLREYHANAPHVHSRGVGRRSEQDLGAAVPQCDDLRPSHDQSGPAVLNRELNHSTQYRGRQVLRDGRHDRSGEPEVRQLQCHGRTVNQNVLWLQVAVQNSVGMAVLQSAEHLVQPSLVARQALTCDHAAPHATAAGHQPSVAVFLAPVCRFSGCHRGACTRTLPGRSRAAQKQGTTRCRHNTQRPAGCELVMSTAVEHVDSSMWQPQQPTGRHFRGEALAAPTLHAAPLLARRRVARCWIRRGCA